MLSSMSMGWGGAKLLCAVRMDSLLLMARPVGKRVVDEDAPLARMAMQRLTTAAAVT